MPRKPGLLWLLMLILFTILRIGEAAHPGPSTELVVGCANANNLLSKADTISKLPAGLWGFSETCLTTGGIEHFQKALKTQKPSQLRYLPGAPAPRTSTNLASIGGKHVGVGFCTHLPARPLTNDWPDEHWQTGRLQTIGAFAGQWIKGGIVYGFAKDCHTPKLIAQTSELLKAITQRVVLQSHGPRFLMGDFNLETDQIELASFWQERGFVEAQTFAHYQWGQQPKKTCKGCTIKDHLWLSREMLPFVKSVHVDNTWFSDHALLYVTLHPIGRIEKVPLWRKPHPIPWAQLPEDYHIDVGSHLQPKEPGFCAEFWQHVESQVDQIMRENSSVGLSALEKGRAQTTEVTWVHKETPPLRRPRKTELQVTFIGDHWQHFYWSRQLRRIQSYCSLTQPRPHQQIPSREIQNLWHSILKAPGCPKGFRNYWLQRTVGIAGTVEVITKQPPDHATATLVLTGFHADFQSFEKLLIQQRRWAAKQTRLEDPRHIYRDTAKPYAQPVQTLLTTRSSLVQEATPEGPHHI